MALDPVVTLLLFAHFIGLMLVATAFFALLGMMPQGNGSPAATSRYLNMLGHTGIVVALVSGPLLIWVRYGGFDGISHWFWAKMLLLVVLAGGIVLSAISSRAMRAGDAVAAGRVRLGRIVASAGLVGVVLTAVLAFQ